MKQIDPDKSLMTGDSTLDDILVECYRSTKLFAKTFFPDTFNAEFSPLHDQIFDLIDEGGNKIVIAAPRGIGKTTIARTVAAKSILYRDKRFIDYISNSATSAEMQTENIKMELLTADGVSQIFGHIRESSLDLRKDESKMFSKKTWVANGHTIIVPRGSGQQIRGQNWIRYRPDLFIIDDLEDTDTLDNEDQRKKRLIWFTGDVEKAKPMIGKDWRYIYIDTVKHEDSLIEHLLESDDWDGLRLSICDDEYHTLAPTFVSQKDLDNELKRHRREKIMDVFAREYQSIPISKEDASFSAEYFQYYQEGDKKFIDRKSSMAHVVIIDPAKTTKLHNAQSGIVVWSIDSETGAMYMREARGEFYHPEQLYTDAFNTCMRYGSRTLAVEVTGLEEFIKHPLRNEMIRLGYNFDLVWLKARSGKGEFSGLHGGKKARVASLVSYYRQGLIYHNEVGCGAYEKQLLGFPKSKRWDIMDAAAYIVELMEMSLTYFMPGGFAGDPEDEYKELLDMYEGDRKDKINWENYETCPTPTYFEGSQV